MFYRTWSVLFPRFLFYASTFPTGSSGARRASDVQPEAEHYLVLVCIHSAFRDMPLCCGGCLLFGEGVAAVEGDEGEERSFAALKGHDLCSVARKRNLTATYLMAQALERR
jgi:hypothetical protein